MHLTPESSTRIFEMPKCEINRHLADHATHCYCADVSARWRQGGTCTATPHDQSTRMCFKSSRLWASSSAHAFVPLGLQQSIAHVSSEARRASPFQFRDASRSSTTLGNCSPPRPQIPWQTGIYTGEFPVPARHHQLSWWQNQRDKSATGRIGFPKDYLRLTIAPRYLRHLGALLGGRYCVSKPDVKFSERGFPLQSLHLQGLAKKPSRR